jgi:hypothetical protein
MRSLQQSLNDHNLILLRVIAEWVGLDLTGTDKAAAVDTLAQMMAQIDLGEELEEAQPEEAQALLALMSQGGRLPVATFSRDYGDIRPMGPGRLEREEPWLDPVNAAEALWYRGFIYRAFDTTGDVHVEYIYIPNEMMARLPATPDAPPAPVAAAPALPPAGPPTTIAAAPNDAVDDLTTLLAFAHHTGLHADRLAGLDALLLHPDRPRRSLLLTLADEMGLVRRQGDDLRPTRAAMDWLQQSREQQLRAMVDAWSQSGWNELRRTPGLLCEGEGWQNDPILARTALLDALPRTDGWMRVDDLLTAVKDTDPDFQRPDGNYDTWYIRDEATHQYLTGFADWDQVEGRLLTFLLQGPLHWLGMVDLAADPADGSPLIRLTERALAWLYDQPPADDEVRVPLVVQPDATLLVPHNASRLDRFQAARIAEAAPVGADRLYPYRLTPSSLAAAQEQGISPERVLEFLARASGRPVPASVRRGVTRWSENGVEGRLQAVVVLRVGDATILETLRANPKTRDYLGESLGDLAVALRPGDWAAFREATAQLGLLLDSDGVLLA